MLFVLSFILFIWLFDGSSVIISDYELFTIYQFLITRFSNRVQIRLDLLFDFQSFNKSHFTIFFNKMYLIEFIQAETAQTEACEKFEAMSARGKQELLGFRTRRVAAFKKSLVELAELEVKHAKSQYEFLRQSVIALRELA